MIKKMMKFFEALFEGELKHETKKLYSKIERVGKENGHANFQADCLAVLIFEAARAKAIFKVQLFIISWLSISVMLLLWLAQR
mgnify:CR=1 FL=1